MLKSVLGSLLFWIAATAHGAAQYSPAQVSECISQASAKYHLHPHLVYAIAKHESGFNAASVNRTNKNGSRDVGVMMINSWWLPTLAKYGIHEADLYDACVNIHVGTWVLARCVQEKGSTWRAVGCYNAISADKQDVYIKKIMRTYTQVRRRAGYQ